MSKAILICGKLCGGKTTYAKKLCKEEKAVLLSCDEITIDILGGDLEDKHDEIASRTQTYLFRKSLEILEAGCSVVLDWGFWKKSQRDYAQYFYEDNNIPCELHFIDIWDETWTEFIRERNANILDGKVSAYYVDDGLLEKFNSQFEKPDPSDADNWVTL